MIEPKERFMLYVEKDPKTECWDWTGSKTKQGAGKFALNGKHVLASWASLEFFSKEKPIKGLHVCHTCSNSSCVNPDHLFVGWHRGNGRSLTLKDLEKRRKAS